MLYQMSIRVVVVALGLLLTNKIPKIYFLVCQCTLWTDAGVHQKIREIWEPLGHLNFKGNSYGPIPLSLVFRENLHGPMALNVCQKFQDWHWSMDGSFQLWPTTTEPSRKASENRKFMGRNISVICAGIAPRHENSGHLKKVFDTVLFWDL